MPIVSINRSRSMRKLADMLFDVEDDAGCESEGESNSSTHCGHSDAEVNCDEDFPIMGKGTLVRCISEDSTLLGSLPFSRVPSCGGPESDFEEDAAEDVDEHAEAICTAPEVPDAFLYRSPNEHSHEFIAVSRDGVCCWSGVFEDEEGTAEDDEEDEGEAGWTNPRMPDSFFYRSPNEHSHELIAVGRDGVCNWAIPALEEWSPDDDEEPLIAVARDGTCRFAHPDGVQPMRVDEEPLIAVHSDGACELMRPIDSESHVAYLNHLSFNPFEMEERSSLVLVSPQGKPFYFEDGSKVDWSLIDAAQ